MDKVYTASPRTELAWKCKCYKILYRILLANPGFNETLFYYGKALSINTTSIQALPATAAGTIMIMISLWYESYE